MPSIVVRVLLFVSSYFPLAVVFSLMLLESHSCVSLAILATGVIGLVGMVVYLHFVRTLSPFDVHIAQVQRRDEEAMSYIVTYVIPFVAIPFTSWREATALIVFLVILGILYVHSNMIHVNPMLNLAGYHFYEVTLNDGSVKTLLSSRRIRRSEHVLVITIADDILLGNNK